MSDDTTPPARALVAGKIGTTFLCCYLFAVALRLGGCYRPDPQARDELPTVGPRVGESFPGFALPDVSGPRIGLRDLAGRPAVLAFVPSLDWSAATKARVVDLAEAVAGRRDVTLAVILTAAAATPRSVTFTREHPASAYFLIDGDGLTEQLGLGAAGPDESRVALPCTFVLDGHGTVVLRDIRRDPRTWLDADAVLAATRLSPGP